MERAPEDPLSRAARQRVRARKHVPRCAASERQQQDPLGGDTTGDERGDARAERRRLPGPGAGEHEQVAVPVQRGGALLGVQLLEPVSSVDGLRCGEHRFAERYGRVRTTSLIFDLLERMGPTPRTPLRRGARGVADVVPAPARVGRRRRPRLHQASSR
jgi:hypothetical protein